jgi:F0F1-type ATP synthase membrane subunit c/vacuolar-type H+-ATPase subunit K
MLPLPDLIHFSTTVLVVSITGLGVGIGEGLTSVAAISAINKQPGAKAEISRVAILGMALIETAAILGLVMAIMLLWSNPNYAANPYYAGIAHLGIAFAIGLSGFTIGIVSAQPAQEACLAIARQPFMAQKILRFMMISQSIIQTPVIFGFIIAMFIKTQAALITTQQESLRLIASGLCIGLGSIGPALGLAYFAKVACQSIGINRKAYNKILSFTFISQAVIETPVIFALMVSLLLITSTTRPDKSLDGLAMISAALCIGLGTIGPGIASGRTAAAACKQIALKPELQGVISRVSMFAQGLIDTFAIYALLISAMLIMFS